MLYSLKERELIMPEALLIHAHANHFPLWLYRSEMPRTPRTPRRAKDSQRIPEKYLGTLSGTQLGPFFHLDLPLNSKYHQVS